MKIVIPAEEKDMQTNVCPSFGRTPYFLLYDTETKVELYLDNSAAAASGGAGIKAAQAIIDSGATAVLTPRCGENAAEVLKAAEIKLYKTADGTLAQNVALFMQNELPELLEIHAGFHQHG